MLVKTGNLSGDGLNITLSEVVEESGVDKNNIAVWVGPGHIQAFVKGFPNCMVIDSYNKKYFCKRIKYPGRRVGRTFCSWRFIQNNRGKWIGTCHCSKLSYWTGRQL